MSNMSRSAAHDQRNAAFREVFRKPFEAQAAMTGTGQTIQEEAQKLKIEHYVEEIPKGRNARLHWLGDRSAKKVLLYFHGTGFGVTHD